MNALAAVFLTDIAKPLYKAVTHYSLNETRAIAVSKVTLLGQWLQHFLLGDSAKLVC